MIESQPPLSVVVSWPSAPLTEVLVRRALAALEIPTRISTSLPSSFSNLLQWSSYDDIDHELMHSSHGNVLSSSYTIRKALIRKHYLARCIDMRVRKHPESVLKNAAPRSWYIDISFADELDEMWSDELYELGDELNNSSKWWILKPGMADRGMGIRLFNSKETLQRIFDNFDDGPEEEEEEADTTSVVTSQLRHFIIQEYLSNPLLLDPSQMDINSKRSRDFNTLNGHKFHMRAYCVASGALRLYLYTRILALFSSAPYSSPVAGVDEHSPIDLTPHLTNTSLQVDRGEEGVRLLDDLVGCEVLCDPEHQRTLTSKDVEYIVDQVAAILAETFKAALEDSPVHFQTFPGAFELYGVDFLVTHLPPTNHSSVASLIQVNILEVNAEPAIELTGPRLTWILEDLFVAIGKVCIEPFFAAQYIGKCGQEKEWEVGQTYHGLRKCLEVEVRGSGGW